MLVVLSIFMAAKICVMVIFALNASNVYADNSEFDITFKCGLEALLRTPCLYLQTAQDRLPQTRVSR